eukprot:7322356-Alexandrium_andersonii.AAC.1
MRRAAADVTVAMLMLVLLPAAAPMAALLLLWSTRALQMRLLAATLLRPLAMLGLLTTEQERRAVGSDRGPPLP